MATTIGLDEFVSTGWNDHAKDPEGVMTRLPAGLDLVTEPRHLASLAALVVHVSGEHLGRWADGIALLERLEALPPFDANEPEGKAVLRSKAVLHTCAGESDRARSCLSAALTGGDVPEASDRVRVLAVVASALAGRKRTAEAIATFEEALALASYGPGKQDPAARALAVTGNNLAAELEERDDRTADETHLMLEAARTARRFWEVAGGWREVERAEYRLALSQLAAGEVDAALAHARECLAIVEKNGSDAGELFFAREARARAHQAAARAAREAAAAALPAIGDEGFRDYCRGELAKLDARLGQT